MNILIKIKTIFVRNFIYINENKEKPHYQLSIKWLKSLMRKDIKNFNIIQGGSDEERPLLYKKMIECVNEIKKKKVNFFDNKKNFNSRFIYSNFSNKIQISQIRQSEKDTKIIFNQLKNIISNSEIFILNYKILFNALPLNAIFKNRYEKKCYLCNKKIDETVEHVFLRCPRTLDNLNYVIEKTKLKFNENVNIETIKYKKNFSNKNYLYVSAFNYYTWITRNTLKYSSDKKDSNTIFRALFNKWFISQSNI